MIDPKLNELPVASRTAADRPASETETSERQRRSRAGLSITDTIAGDTLLSTGARGVDTSGVAAGTGAGGGATAVTPGQASESPAPNIVSGARTTGTTVRSAANQEDFSDSASSERLGERVTATPGTPNTLQIAQRAYEIWCSKGCPEGTADEDWWQAEREFQSGRSEGVAIAAAR